jgi:RNA polymerase sigma-70 factor (ECF subfamily)
MEVVDEPVGTVESLFEQEYVRLVQALGVAFDPESAADAVQEAFIEADRRWNRISHYDDPAAWVRRVALNRLRNGRRNRRRRDEILATVTPVAREDLTDTLLDLRAALDELPERMRVIVCLHYLAGLRVDDVAATLDVAPGTVKSTLHDARTRLRFGMEETRHA